MKLQIPDEFEFLLKPYRFKVAYGGRGSAKSHSFARVLLALGMQAKQRILCAREYQSSISDSVHKLLVDTIYDLKIDYFYRFTNTNIYGINGTEFIFKGLHHSPHEIKSMEKISICWVEEAQRVTENSWSLLIPTIRAPNSEIWVSFNPEDEMSPTYKRWITNPPPNAIVKKINYDKNPWFPQVLRDEMEHCLATDPEAHAHIWLGEPRSLSDANVFRNRWTVQEFETPSNSVFYHGMDFGFAVDPSALIRCFISEDDTLYIDQEAYGHHIEIDELPQLMNTIPTARNWPIYADCARPETISYLHRQGFQIKACDKWTGCVEDGIQHLKGYKIIIHPKCKKTIEEFRLYRYKIDPKTDEVLPVLVDANNHCVDALRYAINRLIQRRGSNKNLEALGRRAYGREQFNTASQAWEAIQNQSRAGA